MASISEETPLPQQRGTPGASPATGRGGLRWRLSLKHAVAAMVVGAMLLLGGLVLALGQFDARRTVLETTTLRVQDVGRLITEQAGRMLEPAEATLRQLSFDPIAGPGSLDTRLARIFVLTEALRSSTVLSAIYVGDQNGDFLLARRLDNEANRKLSAAPAGAAYLVQAVSTGADGQRAGEYIFYDDTLHLVERRPRPGYLFDPRTRPWYGTAAGATATVLSKPYIFFTTRQVGLTLSRKSHGGSSVVGIDVVLDDLAKYLDDRRITPGTEIALVDSAQKVLAYTDMSRVLVKTSDEQFDLRSLGDLGVPSLAALQGAHGQDGKATVFDVDRRTWTGIAMPFKIWSAEGMQLLVAAPLDELTAPLDHQRDRMLTIIALVGLVLLPLGWWAGKMVGRSVDQLIERARCIGRFDFRPQGGKTVHLIGEVHELSAAMDGMVETIDHFLKIGQRMSTETDMDRMLSTVLQQFVQATRCTAGAVYLWDAQQGQMARVALAGTEDERLPAQRAYSAGLRPEPAPAGAAPATRQIELELRGRNRQLEGLLVLHRNAVTQNAEASFEAFARRLSGMLAVSIETRQLIDAQKRLLEAVIRLMADAIDAKSPYAAGHCERVPKLAMQMVDRMHQDTEGPYRDFRMSAAERYAFFLGSWLHDCGKVTSAEHIVDKATKLELIYNRLHEIRMRFEVLWRDAEVAHLHRLRDGAPEAASLAELQARRQQLGEDFAFVAQCNIGGEFMSDEAIARLHAIGAQTWLRHFDDRLGLAAAEQLQKEKSPAVPLPAVEQLLADREEHVVAWGDYRPPVEKQDPRNRFGFDMVLPPTQQNMGELYNLSIRRGTLTAEDRFKINDHVVQTYVMLKNLPWPQELAQVPEIAATHHEKMDGGGYPRRLGADRLTPFDRVMSVADVFEALTAADRPYKAPKTLSESLRIMAFMCKDKHLDTELFRYFLHSGIWRDFAETYMHASQIDAVDLQAIERLLPEAAAAAAA